MHGLRFIVGTENLTKLHSTIGIGLPKITPQQESFRHHNGIDDITAPLCGSLQTHLATQMPSGGCYIINASTMLPEYLARRKTTAAPSRTCSNFRPVLTVHFCFVSVVIVILEALGSGLVLVS